MNVVRTKDEVRAAVRTARDGGSTIGVVPTMGALHEGHLALIGAARERTGFVVVTVFVNPTQFAEGEDLDAYPRTLERDAELARASGADLLWSPPPEEVYPAGFSSFVEVADLTEVLCGDPARRGPEHFRGVTTVVAKLFNVVSPDIAFFGQKDAQQAVVIQRMAADLDFPVEISVQPTVRDADGLALSSRNAYLAPEERVPAVSLNRALDRARALIESGQSDPDEVLAVARAELAEGVELEYLEARDAEDLSAVESFNGRPVLVAIAARVGKTRLIDNTIVQPTPVPVAARRN